MACINHTSLIAPRPRDWLPPLNSHQNSVTRIHIDDARSAARRGDQRRYVRGDERVLVFWMDVRVDFYSEEDPTMTTPFNGLNFRKPIPNNVKNLKTKYLRLLRLELFNDDDVPFPLDGSYCTEEDFHGPGYSLTGGKDELVQKVVDYARVVAHKPDKVHLKLLYVNVGIHKRVFVPEHEFREWVSWYDANKCRYWDFDSDYRIAITKPRKDWRSVSWTRSSAFWDQESEIVWRNSCSICLDEFCDGESVVKFPCGHFFHQKCFDTWLGMGSNKTIHVCPLCDWRSASWTYWSAFWDQESVIVWRNSCSICLDKFCDGESVVKLPCGHLFHQKCIGTWLGMGSDKTSHVCPLCRHRLRK